MKYVKVTYKIPGCEYPAVDKFPASDWYNRIQFMLREEGYYVINVEEVEE